MPGNGAQMYTFQLDSEAAQKVNNGHYKVPLSPPLELPLLAEPQAMVRSVVFCNSFANVHKQLYGNATVNLEWHPDPTSPATATATLTIPDGYYTMEALQLELAKQVYATQSSTYVPDQTTPVLSDNKLNMNILWNYMNRYVTEPPSVHSHLRSYFRADPYFDGHLYMRLTDAQMEADLGVAAGHGATVNKKGSTYLCAWMATVATGTQWNKSHTGQKVIGIAGDGIHANTTLATGTKVKTYFREDTIHGKGVGRGTLLILFELSHALTADVTLNKVITVEFGVTTPGLGVGHLAVPELTEHTDIGIALKADELQAIAQATYSDTLDALHTIPVLTVGTASVNQCDRSVFPFYITQNPGSGAVTFMSCVPSVKVKSTSTLFTKMLGFDGTLHTFESDQDYLTTRSKYGEAQPFTATEAGKVTAARAVQIHVPTIVASTYDRKGKLQGNQMAQVPIPLGTQQNEFVSWQASTPYYIPCQMYGSSIDSIEFYLTNENNEPIDLQVSQFSITMTIGWQSPSQPMLGSAEAEDLPQDIKLAYMQRGGGMKRHY
eukprot:COSAG02_NODE_2955_length_7670_cov_23.923656_6_plen_549_part_00